MTTEFRERARRLRNAVEPVAAGVYFAPEVHTVYAALGFDGSPISQDGAAGPDPKAAGPLIPTSCGWIPAEVNAGFDRSKRRGLMTRGEAFTDAGSAFREGVEVRTDELERPVLDALGDDLDGLVDLLHGWSEAIIDAGGGPHFGSGLTIGTGAEQYEDRVQQRAEESATN